MTQPVCTRAQWMMRFPILLNTTPCLNAPCGLSHISQKKLAMSFGTTLLFLSLVATCFSRFGGNMDAQIVIDAAKAASENHSKDARARLAFQVGYLESSIYELCILMESAEKVMQAQKSLIEQMEKGHSADL